MLRKELNDYIISLDNVDKNIINNKIAEIGIEKYLSQQLLYLDCSRTYNDGTRAMQTIGYPYRYEINAYLYVIDNCIDYVKHPNLNKQDLYDRLLALHVLNLAYEKDNPPVWYGGKKAKDKWDNTTNKPARRRKCKEQTLPGFGKEVSNKEKLKRLSAQFKGITFKIKPPKKD